MKQSLLYILFGFLLVLTSCDSEKVTLSLASYELQMEVGEVVQLEAQVSPIEWYGTNALVWKSSDRDVATVDSKGNIRAVYSGESIISVRAGDEIAKCKVVVGDLSYKLTFTQAKAFVYGDTYAVGANNATLRLYQDGITIGDDGSMSGIGLFMNIDLNYVLSDQQISEGGYAPLEDGSVNSYFPGQIYTEDGITYAVGTFLGEYTQEGFGVVFVEAGVFTVERNGSRFVVDGTLLGSKQESITIHYEGEVPHVDLSGTVDPPFELNFDINAIALSHISTSNQSEQIRLSLSDKNGLGDVVCAVNVPLGIVDAIPTGSYKLGGSGAPFTLTLAEPTDTANGSWYRVSESYVRLMSGELHVTRVDGVVAYSFAFIDEQKRILKGRTEGMQFSLQRKKLEGFALP